MTAPAITTLFTNAPIPDRRFDWQATLADRDPDETQPIGHGATEAEAVADLLSQVAEDAE